MKCKICGGELKLLGSIPFDKNSKEVPIIDSTPMEYYQCKQCLSVSCPEMLKWSTKKLGERIYNEDYIKYDPDYNDSRPKNYAKFLKETFNNLKCKHLDYGSGSGKMCEVLRGYGWDSTEYDPFSSIVEPIGKFKLVTAIEVVEHTLDLDKTLKDVKKYLHSDGIFLFSTRLADKNTDISWWYLGARQGHINIQSEKSLKIIAKRNSLEFLSLNDGVHVMQRKSTNIYKVLNNG
jgi:hypothetical protein